jgi:hypothetical protein
MKEQSAKPYYFDPRSIVLVNHNGKIRRLYAPFKVLCIHPIGHLKVGTWVYVDEIEQAANDELIYLIQGKNYSHCSFCIQIGF